MKNLVIFCFFFLYYFLPSANALDKCTGRESSDVQNSEDQTFYVLECTLSDKSSIADLPSIVRSTVIHGDDDLDDNSTTIDPTSVVELFLTGALKELPENAFSFLPNLRHISVEAQYSNSIETHENAFGNLSNLTSLSFNARFADASRITPDSFRRVGSKLTKLTIQNAHSNGVLTKNDLKYFPNLIELSISDSPDLALSDDETTFGVEAKLQKLDLKRVAMNAYPESIRSLRRLKFLRLADVRLPTLPSNAFSNFASSLIELRLDKNPIENLDPDLFSDTASLKILTLSNNNLTRLPASLFRSLSKLDELNLSGNRLESLPDSLFRNCVRLSNLNLSKNRLSNITRSNLIGLEQNLQHLDLAENRIRQFHASNLSSQLGVSLAANNIDRLENGFFEQGASFNRLILSSNPLEIMDVGAFSGVQIGSENLYIQRANFTRLDLAVFHDMKSVRGPDGDTRIFISNCPNLVGLNVGRSSIKWPSGVKQIVFTNNPRFVLADSSSGDGGGDEQLSKFIRKTDVQFIFDGSALCNCRWHWFRSGKYAQKSARDRVVDFGYFDESSPATCCNIPNLVVEDFLETANFEKYCNGTASLDKATAIDVCPNFDANSAEEPEARK